MSVAHARSRAQESEVSILFRWDGAHLEGRTAIVRTSVKFLKINDPNRVS